MNLEIPSLKFLKVAKLKKNVKKGVNKSRWWGLKDPSSIITTTTTKHHQTRWRGMVKCTDRHGGVLVAKEHQRVTKSAEKERLGSYITLLPSSMSMNSRQGRKYKITTNSLGPLLNACLVHATTSPHGCTVWISRRMDVRTDGQIPS